MNPSLTAIFGFMVVSHRDVNIDVYWNMIIEMISRYKNNSIFKKFYPPLRRRGKILLVWYGPASSVM